MNTPEQTGLIGMGLLGSALARRLGERGFPVVGYDVDLLRREAAARSGTLIGDSPIGVARQCKRIILSLPNSNIVTEVLRQLEPHLATGAVILDTTTGGPEQAVQSAARLQGLGVAYLETNIGGSSKQVQAGDAIVLCGGDATAYDRCQDLIACFGRQGFYVGASGSASRLKLALNLVLGLNRAVLAEWLAFAEASGLSPQTALEVLKAGPAYSRAMDTKGEKMLARDFAPEARLLQHLKDVRLILAEGAGNGAILPLTETHRQILEGLDSAGFGAEDNSAVIRAFLPKPKQ